MKKHILQENYERFFGKLYESDWFVAGTSNSFNDADYEKSFKKLKKGYYVIDYLGGLYEIINLKWNQKSKDDRGRPKPNGDVKLKFVKNDAYKRGHKKKPRSDWDGKVVSWREIANEQVEIVTTEKDYDDIGRRGDWR